MTTPVDDVFQSIKPIMDQVGSTISESVTWLNRTVEDLTKNLPPSVVPVARLALASLPLVTLALILPTKLTVITLSAAAAIGFVAIRNR